MSDLLLIPLSLIAGIASFLGPCHIAMIPIFISYLLANEEFDWFKGLIIGCSYTLGLAITFSMYNFLLQLLPETIFYLPVFRMFAGLVVVVLGIGLLINFDFYTSKISKSKTFEKLTTNFNIIGFGFFGIISGLAWIPCLTPVLATILTVISINQDFIFGYILLLMYAIGLGLPYIMISTLGIQIKSSTLAKWMKYGILVQRILACFLIFFGLLVLLDGLNLYQIFH